MNIWINNYWLINNFFIFGLAIIKHGVPKVENTYSKIVVLKVANNHYKMKEKEELFKDD